MAWMNSKILLFFAFSSCGLVIVASLSVMAVSPRLLAKPTETGFCVSCHVMETQYEAWIHAGAHRRTACVDCHLPNENVAIHYLRKGLDGLKDFMVFYSGKMPDRIKLSSNGKEVLQRNCIRCHESSVVTIDRERQCWTCHKQISHHQSGTIETL